MKLTQNNVVNRRLHCQGDVTNQSRLRYFIYLYSLIKRHIPEPVKTGSKQSWLFPTASNLLF